MDLTGKVALVTGAARRLGKLMARALAERGCHVAVHYGRSAAAADATVEELEALGIQAWPVSADLASPQEIDALFGAVNERFGRLDLLVNSAASFRNQPFDQIEAEDWDDVLALNLRAPFLCIQRAARLMTALDRDAGPALVVNVGDLSALHPWTGYAHHAVSKAGLLHLTRVAARALAPDVRVNAIVPGAILPPPGVELNDPGWLRRGDKVPLARTGDGGEVGHALVFLAENDYVTGAVLPVDGGEHLT